MNFHSKKTDCYQHNFILISFLVAATSIVLYSLFVPLHKVEAQMPMTESEAEVTRLTEIVEQLQQQLLTLSQPRLSGASNAVSNIGQVSSQGSFEVRNSDLCGDVNCDLVKELPGWTVGMVGMEVLQDGSILIMKDTSAGALTQDGSQRQYTIETIKSTDGGESFELLGNVIDMTSDVDEWIEVGNPFIPHQYPVS